MVTGSCLDPNAELMASTGQASAVADNLAGAVSVGATPDVHITTNPARRAITVVDLQDPTAGMSAAVAAVSAQVVLVEKTDSG